MAKFIYASHKKSKELENDTVKRKSIGASIDHNKK